MKRFVSSLLIFTLILSLAGTVFTDTGQAIENYNLHENKTTIVESRRPTCPYWPDGEHRW